MFAPRCTQTSAPLATEGIAIEIRMQAKMAELVSAGRHESDGAPRPGRRNRTERLEPARQAAAALRRVRVPSAARRHDTDRRRLRLRAAHLGDDVECRSGRAGDVSHHAHRSPRTGRVLHRRQMRAADLQHRRTERLGERGRVHRAQPWLPAHRHHDDRAVTRGLAHAPQRRLAVGRDPRPRDRSIAVDGTDRAGDAVRRSEGGVEHRKRVDAPPVDLEGARQRIDAREIEPRERGRRAGGARQCEQAIRGGAVDRGPGPVRAFRGVALDHLRRPSRGVVERSGVRVLRRREGQRSGKLEQFTACEAHAKAPLSVTADLKVCTPSDRPKGLHYVWRAYI